MEEINFTNGIIIIEKLLMRVNFIIKMTEQRWPRKALNHNLLWHLTKMPSSFELSLI